MQQALLHGKARTGEMTVLSDSADTFIINLQKAEADLTAIAHRLEEGFAQQYGRHQVWSLSLSAVGRVLVSNSRLISGEPLRLGAAYQAD